MCRAWGLGFSVLGSLKVSGLCSKDSHERVLGMRHAKGTLGFDTTYGRLLLRVSAFRFG